MSESVFELMKASAVESIPRYRRDLAEMEVSALSGMLGHLRTRPISPAAEDFLHALEVQDAEHYQLLCALGTEDILLLHEAIQQVWNHIHEATQKHAIRQLYQLIAAHFFVYHVQAHG